MNIKATEPQLKFSDLAKESGVSIMNIKNTKGLLVPNDEKSLCSETLWGHIIGPRKEEKQPLFNCKILKYTLEIEYKMVVDASGCDPSRINAPQNCNVIPTAKRTQSCLALYFIYDFSQRFMFIHFWSPDSQEKKINLLLLDSETWKFTILITSQKLI